MHLARWTFGITTAVGAVLWATTVLPAPQNTVAESTAPKPTNEGQHVIAKFIEEIVREQLKTEYLDDDDWGKTRKVTVGYRVKGKPFEWDLKRRTKVVNDGLWEKYKVRLIDPNEHLHVQLSRLEFKDGRVAFGLSLRARLAGDARLERWRQGIKMLNAHIEAEGTVAVHLQGKIGISSILIRLASSADPPPTNLATD
jgi:hypothetical protein